MSRGSSLCGSDCWVGSPQLVLGARGSGTRQGLGTKGQTNDSRISSQALVPQALLPSLAQLGGPAGLRAQVGRSGTCRAGAQSSGCTKSMGVQGRENCVMKPSRLSLPAAAVLCGVALDTESVTPNQCSWGHTGVGPYRPLITASHHQAAHKLVACVFLFKYTSLSAPC